MNRLPLVAILSRLCAGVAFLLAAAAAPAVLALEQTVSLGVLDLNYPDDIWRVDAAAEGGWIAICFGADCDGGVLRITTEENESRCDTQMVREAAAAAFPTRPRTYANMFVVGPLAVYLAQADNGYDPEQRTAVLACVSRAGVRTLFTTVVPADGGLPAFHAGAVFSLLQGLSAEPAPVTTATVQGMALSLPADRWVVLDSVDEKVLPLECLPPYCDGPAFLSIVAHPVSEAGDCSADAPMFGGARAEGVIVAGALRFETYFIDSMCRALSPSQFVACTVHDGMRYTIATGVSTGCHFGPFVGADLVIDLLESARPVSPTP